MSGGTTSGEDCVGQKAVQYQRCSCQQPFYQFLSLSSAAGMPDLACEGVLLHSGRMASSAIQAGMIWRSKRRSH